jgi:hypothetical protein
MALVLTPAAPPIFLTTNMLRDSVTVDGVQRITATSMAAIADRIVDMDPYSTWNSSGSASDTDPQTITIPLYVANEPVVRSNIGMVALLNMNFKTFTVGLYNAGVLQYQYSVSNNTSANWIQDTTDYLWSADSVVIYVTATFAATPNVEKFLGTVIVAEVISQMTTPPAGAITRGAIENVRALTMANGSKNVTRIKRSAASHEFYTAGFKFSYMSDTELATLRTVRRNNPAFIIYPEPGDKVGEIYQCMFTPGSFKSQPTSVYKGAGNDVSFDVQEIE